ncbi:MAG: ribonuclease HII [Nanoarchaeota archaeon]|nr:ribonuclease HII [Nanoarchaeota archaeon]
MVLAGCLVDEEIEEEFKKLGIKDSKQISPKKRQELSQIIKEKALAFEITLTFPNEITEKNKNGVNLNTIEAQKAAEIINKVNKAQGKILVYIDTPSPNLKAWQNVLEGYIENKDNLEIHCEHKADQNHVSCSAASILAKTTRDAEVEKIKKLVGVDFGSGYPSDPLTCKFLKEYAEKHKHDGIFRETWSTWKQVCAKKEQKTLDF